ncbi:hypothetical protein DFH06DRAFT_186770 [Mycena polygramma]|nr:hypothetical protein DFH06DRAFT_186770 [Mycena polygramma]
MWGSRVSACLLLACGLTRDAHPRILAPASRLLCSIPSPHPYCLPPLPADSVPRCPFAFPYPTFRAPSLPTTTTSPADFPGIVSAPCSMYALEFSPTPEECALARAAAPSEALRLPGSTRLYAVVRERHSRTTTRRVNPAPVGKRASRLGGVNVRGRRDCARPLD